MKALFGIATAVVVALALASCTQDARVYPIDPAAAQAGIPKFEFTRQGVGHGPVKVTMPDGEILIGEYQVEENAALGVGFAGAQSFSMVGFGSGRPLVVSATGDRGTIMNCAGTSDIGAMALPSAAQCWQQVSGYVLERPKFRTPMRIWPFSPSVTNEISVGRLQWRGC